MGLFGSTNHTKPGKEYDPGIFIKQIENIFRKHYSRDGIRYERILYQHVKNPATAQIGPKLRARAENSLRFTVKGTVPLSRNELPKGQYIQHGGWIEVTGHIRDAKGRKFDMPLYRVYFVQEKDPNRGAWQPVRMAGIQPLNRPQNRPLDEVSLPGSEAVMARVGFDILCPHAHTVDPDEHDTGETLLHDIARKWVPHAVEDYNKVGGANIDAEIRREVSMMHRSA